MYESTHLNNYEQSLAEARAYKEAIATPPTSPAAARRRAWSLAQLALKSRMLLEEWGDRVPRSARRARYRGDLDTFTNRKAKQRAEEGSYGRETGPTVIGAPFQHRLLKKKTPTAKQ